MRDTGAPVRTVVIVQTARTESSFYAIGLAVGSFAALELGRTIHVALALFGAKGIRIIPHAEALHPGLALAIYTTKGADVFVGVSVANVVSKEMVASMNEKPIIFAMANPNPEITYHDALSVRKDLIMGTGRSDFPNQVNNSLGFPGIFRGTLDVRARTITDEMCFAAAQALANQTGDQLSQEHILPTMDDWEVFPREAVACALESIKEGVARVKLSKQELWDRAVSIIRNAMDSTALLMKNGLIPPPPSEEEVLGSR